MAPRHARVLVGAAAKVGKTWLLSEWAPATTLIIDTQNGTRLLPGEHYVEHVHDWRTFVRVVDDICRGGHNYRTFGLDLTNDLWHFCDLHHGKPGGKEPIPASAIDDYGRSVSRARTAFKSEVGRLLATPYGIWFITHLQEKTDKKGELVVYKPDLDKNVNAYITGAADFVWLAETQPNGDRIVHTRATQHFEAGSRRTLPSPLAMDARVIAGAMDRALNPERYDAAGERVKDAPEPPAVAPETGVPPSDIPSDIPWSDADVPGLAELDAEAAV